MRLEGFDNERGKKGIGELKERRLQKGKKEEKRRGREVSGDGVTSYHHAAKATSTIFCSSRTWSFLFILSSVMIVL